MKSFCAIQESYKTPWVRTDPLTEVLLELKREVSQTGYYWFTFIGHWNVASHSRDAISTGATLNCLGFWVVLHPASTSPQDPYKFLLPHIWFEPLCSCDRDLFLHAEGELWMPCGEGMGSILDMSYPRGAL